MGSESTIQTDPIRTNPLRTGRILTDRRPAMSGLSKLLDQGVLAFALVVTALASAFIGYKNGRIDLRFADAVSDNNFLQAPFIPHDINIQNIHTHLLKWPVMLLEKDLERWLDPKEHAAGEMDDLLAPYPAELMEAYPVGKDVGSPRNDGPGLIKRVAPEPTTLFG